jgi:hypothetical protein
MHRVTIRQALVSLAAGLLFAVAWSASAPTGRPAAAGQAPASAPLFLTSSNCVACHNQLTGPDGEDVSIGASWRSSMMANAGRDPYFHASVRRETLDHPKAARVIENECATCHLPMDQRGAVAAGQSGSVLTHVRADPADDGEAHQLARDGVSCTVCHQISSERLGTPASFNGQFAMLASGTGGIRQIAGPHAIDQGRRTIMRSVTGYEQLEAPHVQQSELCATCHTLITEALDAEGNVIGRLPEQMNYQEWQHSAFAREKRSCQSCHMPRTAGPVRIASVLGDYRDGLSRHLFVGGNAFMLRLLNRYREPLGVEALPGELETTARATVHQLQHETATVAIDGAGTAGATLSFGVRVNVSAGHKFPTGYPARRVWLHVVVRDAAGAAAFESGAVQRDGSIAGNDADGDASRSEPHYRQITRPDEVQIFESVMGDVSGRPTTGLLQATRYLKDNRLLPRGFDKATAPADIAVVGEAASDPDFAAEGDRVEYRVDVGNARGPFAIDVELCYQPIGYRWARNLERYDAPEPRRFLGYYTDMAPSASVVVSSARLTLSR